MCTCDPSLRVIDSSNEIIDVVLLFMDASWLAIVFKS